MANKFDVDQLRVSMEALIRDFPDLEDDEMLRVDMLEGATDMKEVLARLARGVGGTATLVSAITGRLTQLTDRRARFVARIEYLRGLILSIMQAGDLKTLELPEVTLSQRKAPRQIVGLVDPDTLPDDVCTISRVVSRTKVREALEAGRELPGLSLGNAAPSLQIKAR